MATICHQYREIYKDVPDFAVKMLCKFLNLLLSCFTEFHEIQMIDPSFHRFHLGDQWLAFDFNIGPFPQQMHGLFAKIRFLHSHYQRTFEEMVRYNFIENYMITCFGPLATMQEIFLATRLEEVDRPLPFPPLQTPAQAQRKKEIEDAIKDTRPVPSNLPYTREQIRHLTSLMADAFEERECQRTPQVKTRNTKKRTRQPPPPPLPPK